MIRSSRAGKNCRAATALFAVVLVPLAAAAPALASTEVVATQPGMLAAPAIIGPDESTQVLSTVNLQWQPVAGATGYKVQVGTEDSWSDTPVLDLSTTNTTLTLPTSLPHGTYDWRVAALKGSVIGHWSSEEGQAHDDAQFVRGWRDVPTTLKPSAGSVVDSYSAFSWTPIANASEYEVEVSSDPTFPVAGAAGTPDTSPTPSTQDNGQATDICFTSRTRVTPYTGQGSSEKSNAGACSWTLEASGTGTPLFWRVRGLNRVADTVTDYDTTPIAHGISSAPPSFTPDDSSLTSDCPAATGCTPSNKVEFGSWSSTTSFQARTFAQTYAFEHVDGTTLDFSHANDVVTAAIVPTSGTKNPLSDPDSACTRVASSGAEHDTCTDVPTITWNYVPGATSYRVIYALDDQMSNVTLEAELYGNSFTPSEAWRDGTGSASFYYVVQACDDTACGSVTSTPPSFEKKSPRTTVLTSPSVNGPVAMSWTSYQTTLANGQTVNAGVATPASSEAFAYHVQVAKAADVYYSSPVLDINVDSTSLYPTTNLPDGKLIWRVQAVNDSGHFLPWSSSASFSRDTTPPKVVKVAPNARVGTKTPVTVTFSEPVTGVSASSLSAVLLGKAVPAVVKLASDGTSATITPTKPMVPGATYAITLTSAIEDAVGNAVTATTGPTFAVSPYVDDINATLAYSAGWTRLISSNANGGTYHQTSGAHTISTPFHGTAVAVTGCLSPSGGIVDITVGSITKRVSTYRSYSGCGVVLTTIKGLTRSNHTLSFKALGRHVAASRGNLVGFDSANVHALALSTSTEPGPLGGRAPLVRLCQ